MIIVDKFEELQKEFKVISKNYDERSNKFQEIISFLEKANKLYGKNTSLNKEIEEMMDKVIPIINELKQQGEALKEKADAWRRKSENY